jgi:hypothetical protein
MKLPSACSRTACAAALLVGCAVGARGSKDADFLQDPTVVAVDAPPEPDGSSESSPRPNGEGRIDEATGDILPDALDTDASVPGATDPAAGLGDSGAGESGADASTMLGASDATVDAADAGLAPRCVPGSRSLVTLSVAAQVDHTVLLDEQNIYYQRALTEDTTRVRHELMAVTRTALHDASSPPAPFVVTREDYALGSLVADDDGHLYFIAMPAGDSANQGLFRVVRRERVGVESVPIHALASDDYWPGQLAIDENFFYLASIGGGSRTLRIVRIARVGYQREELWVDSGEGNDDSAAGAMSLRAGDIALAGDHVYFTARINGSAPAQQFRVYRVNKQGRQQTPVLLTTLENSHGGLASDGAHLFFSHNGNLEQWDLQTAARERLVSEPGMRDLRHFDGVLSWTPSSPSADNLHFFCL